MARLNLIECDRCGAKEDAKSAEVKGTVTIRLHRLGVGEGPAVDETKDLCAECFDKVANAIRAVLLPQLRVDCNL